MTREASILFIPSSVGGSLADCQKSVRLHSYIQQALDRALLLRAKDSERSIYLGRTLAALARDAEISRRFDDLETISELMQRLPVPRELRTVGQYYSGLLLVHRGHFEDGEQVITKTLAEIPAEFKGRAFNALGSSYYYRGQADNAAPFFLVARQAATDCDPVVATHAQWWLAITRSVHGDHKRALADLEALFPRVIHLAKWYPALYYDFLNSLAVEMGELGQVNEAQAALNIALGSRYASAFPSWSETRQELDAKRTTPRRSMISLRAVQPTGTANQRTAAEKDIKPKAAGLKRRPGLLRLVVRGLRWLAGLTILNLHPISLNGIRSRKSSNAVQPSALSLLIGCGLGPRAPPSF